MGQISESQCKSLLYIMITEDWGMIDWGASEVGGKMVFRWDQQAHADVAPESLGESEQIGGIFVGAKLYKRQMPSVSL